MSRQEANLARRYEAAAERNLYRALRELREAEAEARAEEAEVAGATPSPITTPEPPAPPRKPVLGSFRTPYPADAKVPAGIDPYATPARPTVDPEPSGPVGSG